jgi:dTDP-L-rhamnose 4-epimerase
LLLVLLGASPDGYRISGDFRTGDVRSAVAEIARARALLGWEPKVRLEDGLHLLAEWARHELASDDFVSAERT